MFWNTFFSSVLLQTVTSLIFHQLGCNMEELVIDEKMVKKKLDNFNVRKSVGPDGVHPRLLKELSNHLCIPLARLFNNSLAVGELSKE